MLVIKATLQQSVYLLFDSEEVDHYSSLRVYLSMKDEKSSVIVPVPKISFGLITEKGVVLFIRPVWHKAAVGSAKFKSFTEAYVQFTVSGWQVNCKT